MLDTGQLEALAAAHGRPPDLLVEIDDGYDYSVAIADGAWAYRFPRRPEVAAALERELALLPLLAAALPVAVPRFERVLREPALAVGYRLIEGAPMRDEDPAGVAALLSTLHALDPAGLPAARPAWREEYAEQCARFAQAVLPLLDPDERVRAARLLAAVGGLEGFEPALVHGDLGPAHLLCRDGRLVGVIDWGDARVGDPALDLAWPLYGHPRGEQVLDAYTGPVDAGFPERARFYHRLGPWFEVDHGLLTGRRELVASGLAGVRARLP